MKKKKATIFNNKSLIDNREIRFFLSSTFKDMEEERNAIVKVFHELRVEAARRNVILTMVDLRWGVSREESRTGKVLSVCLGEIEHSHPFFIGLLGGRYGSHPSLEDLKKNKDLEERYPWVRKDIENELSITEIEIQYGVLRNTNEVDAAFFINKTSTCPPDDHERLTWLKKKVSANKKVTCDDYYSIKDLCHKVRARVKDILDKHFGEVVHSEIARQQTAQLAYINTYHTHYVKSNVNFGIIDEFVRGGGSYLVIGGESGMGKSALVANWIKENKDRLPCRMIYYFLGNSSTSNDYTHILSYIRDNLYDLYQVKRSGFEKSLKEETQRLLVEATEKGAPLLIIIDGVNQVMDRDNAKLLNWLPTAPSPKVKLLFTTLEGDETWERFKCLGYPRRRIKPLTKDQRRRFSKRYLSYVGKKLDKDQLEKILSARYCSNTLVLRTLLDELICFGSYRKLNRRINYYLASSSIENFFHRMLKRMEADYSPDQDLVRHTLSLIALSEDGLSEEEIIKITGVRQMDWYSFYSAFYHHLIQRQGLVTFSHQYVAEAVRKRYKLSNTRVAESCRREIVSFFETSEEGKANSRRQTSEFSFQYFHLKDCERLHKTILSFDAFNHFCNTDLNPLAAYWRMLLQADKDGYSLQDYLRLPCDGIPAEEMPYLNVGLFADLYFGDYPLAIECYRRNIQETVGVLGAGHPHVGAAYNNMGDTYARLSEPSLAMECYRKALSIAENALGPDHPDTATVYNNVGAALADMGDYKSSMEYLERALEVHRTFFGENHPSVAHDYNNIGMVYNDYGYYDEAGRYCEKACAISEATQGREHPDTAFYISNLGEVCARKKEFDKAKSYYVKALSIKYGLYGMWHPEIASLFNSMGLLYYDQGDYDVAMEFFAQAKKVSVKTQGKEHPDTATAYNNMGLACYSLHAYKTAFKYYSLALDIRRRKLGEDHPDTAFTYNNLGVLHYNGGRKGYPKALDCLFKSLGIRERVLPKDHQETAQTCQNIGDVYFDMGDCPRSLRYHLKALAMRERTLGSDHPYTGISYAKIGSLYDHAGKFRAALGYYSMSLPALEKDEHPQVDEVREKVKMLKMLLAGQES